MASGAKLTVYVDRTINYSSLRIRGVGSYGALSLSGLTLTASKLPLYSTASQKVFWEAVLVEVQAQLAALPG